MLDDRLRGAAANGAKCAALNPSPINPNPNSNPDANPNPSPNLTLILQYPYPHPNYRCAALELLAIKLPTTYGTAYYFYLLGAPRSSYSPSPRCTQRATRRLDPWIHYLRLDT